METKQDMLPHFQAYPFFVLQFVHVFTIRHGCRSSTSVYIVNANQRIENGVGLGMMLETQVIFQSVHDVGMQVLINW